MSSKWYSTLEESRAQFGGYKVNPEIITERILTRVFYGIDKTEFPTLRATLDATTEITAPLVDNQTYTGTWRISDIRTEEGTGELAGSLTVYQDIKNELNDGQDEDNEYLAGMQSKVINLIEYRWMVYRHYKQTTTKKWVSMTSDSAVEGFELLSKMNYRSDIPDSVLGFGGAAHTLPSKWWNAVFLSDASGQHPTLTEGKYYIIDKRKYWSLYGTWSLDVTEVTNPTIENCYYQEEKDHSFTLYRSLSELTYPAFMREIYYQYAGLIITSALPVEDSNTIKLSGFLNQTEKIYEDARFRIEGDTYRVTADATCVAGAVTLAVTPKVTAATAEAHMFDVSNIGAQVFFNAIG